MAATRVLRSVAIACALLAATATGGLRADEAPRSTPDAKGLDVDALGALLRRTPSTPELTQAVLRAHGAHAIGLALDYAAMDIWGREAPGPEILHVAGHVLAFGTLRRWTLNTLWFLAGSDAVFEGVLQSITHPRLHTYIVELDVQRVLVGWLDLTRANRPLRFLARGAFEWWTGMPEDGRTIVVLARREGEHWESGHVWESTGREGDLVTRMAPLGWKDPKALVDGMHSEDATVRWLATVRTIHVARDLGEPFGKLEKTTTLDRDRMDMVRDEVAAALKALAPQVVWDIARDRLARRP